MEFLTTWWAITIEIVLGLVLFVLLTAFTKGFCDELLKKEGDDILGYFAGIIWPIFWFVFFVAAIIFWAYKGIKKISGLAADCGSALVKHRLDKN